MREKCTFDYVKYERIVFLADVHLGVRNASIEWSEIMKDYFDNFFCARLRQLSKEKKTALVIAGDYFDNRKHIDISVLNMGYSLLTTLTSICNVFLLVGNHDIYKKSDTSCASVNPFQSMYGVEVVGDLSVMELANERSALLIPWVGDSKEESSILTEFERKCDIAVMHSEISGLSYDNGLPITDGANVSGFRGQKIYSGHIHLRQTSKDGRVTYLGAPYQLRRSDIGNDKGVFYVDFDGEDIKEYFILNDYSPKFLRFTYEEIEKMDMEQLSTNLKNNYVDILMKRDDIIRLNIGNLIANLEEYGPKKIEILPMKETVEDTKEETAFDGDITLETAFITAVSKLEVTEEVVKRMNEMNVEYVTRAREELNIVEG